MSRRFAALAAVVTGAWLGACMVDFGKYEPLATPDTSAGGGSPASAGGTGGSGPGGTGGSSSGGSGGAGGGGATPCGTVDLAADDFADGSTADWFVTQGSGATIAETGGERVVTLPNQTASWSGFSSRFLYDLRDSRTYVEVLEAPSAATTATGFFTLTFDGQNFISIVAQAGQLQVATHLGGLWNAIATAAYDPVMHRWWQFREQAGTIHWETSPDGQAWTEHASRPVTAVFPVDLLQIEHGALTQGGQMSPGQARFDNLGGGGPPVLGWCPVGSLSDDFEDGVLGRAWWSSYEGGGCQNDEIGGRVVVTMSGPPIDCGYITAQAFDMTGGAASIEVPTLATALSTHYAFFRSEIDLGNGFAIVYYGGDLRFEREQGGMSQLVSSKLYSPTEDRFWRLREESGSVHFETSADGMTWIDHTSSSNPFDASRMAVLFGAGVASMEPNGVAEFDNYNLLPP